MNETLEKIKAMIAADPALESDMRKAWGLVCDKIEARALARRPKPRSFEVHHETEVARATFLNAVATGDNMLDAEAKARSAIGLD